MPRVIYKLLGIGKLKPTSMKLLIAETFMKKPVVVLCDVVVWVASFMFPTYFMIHDSEMDFQAPIILSRPILEIVRALIDMKI